MVAIILDSPRGLHMGGSVSAPVFPRVAEEVLRYLRVPQELPIDPAVRRRRGAPGSQPDPKLLAEVTDFTPDNGLTSSLPPKFSKPTPRRIAGDESGSGFRGLPRTTGSPVLLAVSASSMPDFYGKPVREVVEQATAIGLAVDLKGSGVARRQSPSPGSPLLPGVRATVEFEW